MSNNDSVIAFVNKFLIGNRILSKNTSVLYFSGLQEPNSGTTEQMRVVNIGGDIFQKNQK